MQGHEYEQDNHDDDNGEDEDEENAVPEYKQLIAIHAGKPKGDLQTWLADSSSIKIRRLSLSEQELENAIKNDYGADIVRYAYLLYTFSRSTSFSL